MRFQDFETNIKMLSSWLNKKLTDAQLEVMFDDLQHIPGEAFNEICGSVRRSKAPNTAFPSINDFLMSWESWQKGNIDRMVRDEKEPCQECHGVGYFIVGYASNGFGGKHKGWVNCATCKNNPGMGIIRLALAEIYKRGWTVEAGDQPVSPIGGIESKRNVYPVVERSFHEPREWREV
jgi:hypothetical protein